MGILKDDLLKKFVDCAHKAVKNISRKKLEKITNDIMNLEEVEDICEIMGCFRQ